MKTCKCNEIKTCEVKTIDDAMAKGDTVKDKILESFIREEAIEKITIEFSKSKVEDIRIEVVK